MSSSLSGLVDNLSDRLHNDNCICCNFHLECTLVKDYQLIFRFFECKKYCKKEFNKNSIKIFTKTYRFCDGDINKVILLLRKGNNIHTNTWIAGEDLMKHFTWWRSSLR